MARKIIWSNQAQQDRKEILKFWFIKTRSKAYSKILNQQFNYSIKLLQTHPYIGKSTNIEEIKIKIVRDYFLIYKFNEKELIIISLWDSRQDPIQLKELIS
ncbi:hypothetical protein A5893_10255 [Pedobacter psychrophilus]|uniref:Plasmid stabilization protein n=1 Tax=Pedobacter psychrophilus TaxID=1826909 RepID=A0A179DDE0_9SPHI|nr:type II toxin-antitoxin system RelE/ParE family toxin [Pedobacter psychrophilus]OAQ39051.1 hypothetical protein A5893_10255 [Pedobacter psychrophilus]